MCYAVLRDDRPCPYCPWLGPIEPDQRGSLEVDGLLGGRSFRITYRLLEVDGERALLEVFEDITAAKAAEQAMQESFAKLQRTLEGTVRALATMAEKRDPYTAGHQQRWRTPPPSQQMGLSAEKHRRSASPPCSMISARCTSPRDLNKPGKLTPVEMD